MKITIKYTLIIFLFFSFIIVLSCGKQKTEWKGSIEEENGVTVVKNPKEPIYSEDVFSLEEELSFGGAEASEEYMFNQLRSIAVDENGRIYALDMRDRNLVFARAVLYSQFCPISAL